MSTSQIMALYALPTSTIIGIVLAFLLGLALRQAVTKGVDASFRRLELEVANRAAFADRIQNQRFALVIDISRKLEEVRSELERLIDEKVTQEEIAPKGETKGLTKVHEELRVSRVVLGAELSKLLEDSAFLAGVVASNWKSLQEQMKHGNKEELDRHWTRWTEINDHLSAAVARAFAFPQNEVKSEGGRRGSSAPSHAETRI